MPTSWTSRNKPVTSWQERAKPGTFFDYNSDIGYESAFSYEGEFGQTAWTTRTQP